MPQLFYPDWRDLVTYSDKGPQPQAVFENEKFKSVVVGLEPGQKIPLHPEGAGVFLFLEGTGTMLVDNARFAVKPGAIVVAPDGAKRGVEAQTRLAFIAVRVA